MRILALDTATESCSVALSIDGEDRIRDAELPRGHAERILTMIDQVLAEADASLRSLDAIAFGRGPGSFTGVRLAVSVVQGLAFGADLPVVPVSDLRAVAQRVLHDVPGSSRVLICNDARMNEVYWACFERGPDGLAAFLTEECVGAPGTVTLPSSWTGEVAAAGRGFAAYPGLASRLSQQLGSVHDRLLPHAREIALLARTEVQAGRTVAAEQALPTYLRDEVARPQS
ncbi:MAG TPA: tRNA (adenosine(37)-N6)-threonylcarbamoyltransferase complex dimerization subunit type 1 TsaB [Steroidobacteraceae bacterium]|nr:tRNA (adenosine(37)-N6)-threonylcarbamoyltransferase complex dimerization subunit type 1 TsaB [Steroidobacteraceae bacterium]